MICIANGASSHGWQYIVYHKAQRPTFNIVTERKYINSIWYSKRENIWMLEGEQLGIWVIRKTIVLLRILTKIEYIRCFTSFLISVSNSRNCFR